MENGAGPPVVLKYYRAAVKVRERLGEAPRVESVHIFGVNHFLQPVAPNCWTPAGCAVEAEQKAGFRATLEEIITRHQVELIAEEEKPWICQVLTISPMTAAKEARNATKLTIFPMIHLVDTDGLVAHKIRANPGCWSSAIKFDRSGEDWFCPFRGDRQITNIQDSSVLHV